MCWKKIAGLFRKSPVQPPVAPDPTPESANPVSLPHPEEPRVPSATSLTIDVRAVISAWFTGWGVPAASPADNYRAWWLSKVQVVVTEGLMLNGFPCPSYCEPWVPAVHIDPTWCNPGVIAHEMCHVTYHQLTAEEKAGWEVAYMALRGKDPLIKLMRAQHPYADANMNEAHSEVYRYLGQQMPESLKRFYPRLF
jgi:hypothetical protein